MLCGQPARFVLCVRSKDLFGRRPAFQSPGSRRGVAPFRLGAPPVAPFSPALPAVAIVRQGRAALRPSGRLASRARPPRRGSLPASGSRRTTAARRPARPSGIWYCSFARSRQTSLAGPRALRPAPRPHKPADAPLGRFCLVLRAVGRQALRADCLGPPVF